MSDLFSDFSTVQQLAERNSGSSRRNSGFLGYIYWPSKVPQGQRNEKIVRFLHDGVIVIWFHERMNFESGRRGDVVCLRSPAIDNQKENCPLCDQELRYAVRGVGLAVEREEKVEGSGASRRSVVSDRLYDIEDRETGQKSTVPYLGTVKQGLSNFWNNLAPIAYRHGTVTNRDIQVTRSGSDTSTSYSFLPFDVDPDMDDIEKVLKHYDNILQGRSPQEVIMDRMNNLSSDQFYKRNLGENIFKGAKVATDDDTVAGGDGAGYAAQTDSVPGPAAKSFSDLKSQLSSYSAKGYDDDPDF
jgi:hypothetical protein